MSETNGKRVKKEKFSSNLEHKLAFYLGVTERVPESTRLEKATYISEKNCDSKWIASIAKSHIFGEFYENIVNAALKFGTTEKEKQEYFKKLMNLLSQESLSYSQEPDRIERFKRQQLSLKTTV